MSLIVATFYKFVSLPDAADLRGSLQTFCDEQGVCGTILLALEGINATIAGTRHAIDAVLAYLRSDPRFADLVAKESTAETPPFDRMKVRLKREIVTLGQPEVNPSERVGTYVAPKEWNTLISDPEVLVVDTRNDYEVQIGTFRTAHNPQTESFRQFPDYVRSQLDPATHRKVALFCTGGIRCEKATAYMLEQGFEEVFHLQGGILKYLEEVPPEESLWEGECYVFDQRVAVKHGLELGSYDSCLSCGRPISDSDKASTSYEFGVSCPHCIDTLTPEKRDRQLEKVKQLQLRSPSFEQ